MLPSLHRAVPTLAPTSAALDLLATVHQYDQGRSYALDYPTVFCEQDPALVATLLSGGRASGCAAAIEGWVDGGPEALGLARIGSVATHPAARGQGIATRLIELLHRTLATSEMAVSALWAERGGLYARLGYHPVGQAWLCRAPASSPYRPGLEITIDTSLPSDLPPRMGFNLRRSPQQTQALAATPDMQVALATRKGKLVAYAVMGKGRDMQGIIHDWYGDEDVLPLMVALGAGGPCLVLTPQHHPLTPHLGRPVQRLPMAWMAVLDRPRLLRWAQAAGAPLDPDTLSDGALLRRLFGSPPGLASAPSALTPLFIWGLDSI